MNATMQNVKVAPFAEFRSQVLGGDKSQGLYDLAYFSDPDSAQMHRDENAKGRYAYVLETSQGSIWRSTIKVS
mgnify:FL=1